MRKMGRAACKAEDFPQRRRVSPLTFAPGFYILFLVEGHADTEALMWEHF